MDTVEIEERFRITNDDLDLNHLASLGIVFDEPVTQDDQAYAPQAWDYGQPRIGVAFARLRTESGRHLFTVKTPITDVRTCRERETPVADRAAMHEAILMMGFRPTIRIYKRRRTAAIPGGVTLCLDDVAGVGQFIEVEVIASAGADFEELRARMRGLIDSLGLSLERVTDSYDTLVRAATEGDSTLSNLTVTAA